MNQLTTGVYFGRHNQCLSFPGLVITDTDYTHEHVDWHYHENAYFTYLLQGKLFEANKKDSYHLTTGSLLFHNWQDTHYNIKPPVFTRGFHIELSRSWFEKFDLSTVSFEGSLYLKNPLIKETMNKIFLAAKGDDAYSQLEIELLVLDVFNRMREADPPKSGGRSPAWVGVLREMIHEPQDFPPNLSELAGQLGIHPVHLSREFPRYFDLTLGRYLRLQKANKAALLMANSTSSLTEISYECGFYDQSHFIANFKKIYGITPSKFRKQVRSC